MEHKRARNSGFTLVETLVVVAVLVTLLSVSAVSIGRSRDALELTELDNAAWEIYMAAQNRAVLLQNGGRLPLADGAEAILSNDSATDMLNELLPEGSIDPTLRAGHFRIVYDDTGYVSEVFYAEETIGDNLASFRRSASERISAYRAGSPLVGYYG